MSHKPGRYGTRHYDDLARVIAAMDDVRAASLIAHQLAKHFEAGNSKFDVRRWYDACWPHKAQPSFAVSRR